MEDAPAEGESDAPARGEAESDETPVESTETAETETRAAAERESEGVLEPEAESDDVAMVEPSETVPMTAGAAAPAGEAVSEGTPAAAPAEDERKWYVVHCYSGYENKVRHNLEQRIESMGMKDKIFDVVVPTEEEIEVRDGKRRTVERRVFPGYLLVQMILSEESWYVVRNTPGVTGFVGMGNEPTPLRPEEVAQIVKRMEAEAPRIKVTSKIG
ncbi:MAG: transcription termination/antitermination protein NusG, partial [Anaerolineales bacterium]